MSHPLRRISKFIFSIINMWRKVCTIPDGHSVPKNLRNVRILLISIMFNAKLYSGTKYEQLLYWYGKWKGLHEIFPHSPSNNFKFSVREFQPFYAQSQPHSGTKDKVYTTIIIGRAPLLRIPMVCPRNGTAFKKRVNPFRPQSRFGDKPLKVQVVWPQNETAVLKVNWLIVYSLQRALFWRNIAIENNLTEREGVP